jgi:hypothetical protein
MCLRRSCARVRTCGPQALRQLRQLRIGPRFTPHRPRPHRRMALARPARDPKWCRRPEIPAHSVRLADAVEPVERSIMNTRGRRKPVATQVEQLAARQDPVAMAASAAATSRGDRPQRPSRQVQVDGSRPRAGRTTKRRIHARQECPASGLSARSVRPARLKEGLLRVKSWYDHETTPRSNPRRQPRSRAAAGPGIRKRVLRTSEAVANQTKAVQRPMRVGLFTTEMARCSSFRSSTCCIALWASTRFCSSDPGCRDNSRSTGARGPQRSRANR